MNSATHFGELVISETAVAVPSHGSAEPVGSLEALFEHVRRDNLGRYRPLSGARTLPGGWEFRGEQSALREAVDVVYPLARIHVEQFANGTLRVVPLDDVLMRQSGRYEDASGLPAPARRRAVSTVCGACVRVPVWDGQPLDGGIPCPEACSVMVAFCREAALWEAEAPEPAEVDLSVPWAAFDEPGNELRERYLQELRRRNE